MAFLQVGGLLHSMEQLIFSSLRLAGVFPAYVLLTETYSPKSRVTGVVITVLGLLVTVVQRPGHTSDGFSGRFMGFVIFFGDNNQFVAQENWKLD